MRTPNASCSICGKSLYRRPYELRRVRYVVCCVHRAEGLKRAGVTPAQRRGLALGRQRGTNHRTGYKHRASSKRLAAASNRAFWQAHPDKAAERGVKTRGPLHYNWKGGLSRLNQSIRQMTENRKWMDAVKARDGKCVECGSVKKLESHHIVDLAVIVALHGVKNRADARACPELWDLANGKTLCERCHYRLHGRKHAD